MGRMDRGWQGNRSGDRKILWVTFTPLKVRGEEGLNWSKYELFGKQRRQHRVKKGDHGWLSGLGNLVAAWECDWTCQGYTEEEPKSREKTQEDQELCLKENKSSSSSVAGCFLHIRHCSSDHHLTDVLLFSMLFLFWRDDEIEAMVKAHSY